MMLKIIAWLVLTLFFSGLLVFVNQVGVGYIPHRPLSYDEVKADLPYTIVAGGIFAYGLIKCLKK